MTECQTSRLQDQIAELQERLEAAELENLRLRALCKKSLDRMIRDECGDPLTHEQACYCTITATCLPCKLRAALGDSR